VTFRVLDRSSCPGAVTYLPAKRTDFHERGRVAGSTRHAVRAEVDVASHALQAVAGIAARLALRDELDDKIEDVLEQTRLTIGADECALWLFGPHGIVRTGAGSAAQATSTDVSAALAADTQTAAGVLVKRVSEGERALGVIAVRTLAPLSREHDTVLSIVASLLAPELVHAARAHQLEVEVEMRTRQIDEQHRFTEKIIDSLPVGLYVIDREYRIKAWNRKRETGMQGVSREEAIGRTIFEILHRQPAESLRQEFDEVLRSGRIQVFHMDTRASGEVRTFRISKIPMRLTDGAVTHVITIGEDVTEWKEAQERFAQSEKLAAIGQLAAGVMHEINNPLATIAACGESLSLRLDDMREAGQQPPKDAPEFLRIIDHEVHRCKGIVDGLLNFSRPKPATKERTDVNEVIEQTIFLVKHHSRFKKLKMKTELDTSIPRIHGNREQLIQVFMALLINAVDAMEDNGQITIRTYRSKDAREGIVAEVVDEGQGIARTEHSKIFEPFYTTKAPGRGTGLGLSIVYGIVTDHNGRIEVDSTPGQGSTFRILLPAESTA
jgi:PAS domain S-box-containing protein